MNWVELCKRKGVPKLGRAVGVVVDFCRYVLGRKSLYERRVAEPKHDQMDRLSRFFNGIDEGVAEILARLIGVKPRGFIL
jgi:hypothetical protein